MSEKSKRNLVKPRSRPFRSGWSPPSAGLSGSRGFSRAAIRACRRLRPEVGREGDHGVARSGRVRASLASVPRSALADAFGPRSAARLSATSGLGRWFLPRARTRVSDRKLDLAVGEEHHPAIRRDPSAIERGAHLLARHRWQVKGQRYIVVHNSLPPLDCCAASATRIMPHIHVSGYFRLTVPVDEVIE